MSTRSREPAEMGTTQEKALRWPFVLALSATIVGAILALLVASAYFSDHPRSLEFRGRYYLWREDYENALACFEKVTLKLPTSAEAWYHVARAYEGLKRWPEAIQTYRRTIELAPDHALAHYRLGLLYLNLDDRASARRERDILNALDPHLARLLSNRLMLVQ